MSKKMNGFKRTLMAAVCAASVMATAIPVSAAEMVDPAVIAQLEDSISVAASCSCKKELLLMSRQCSKIDDNSHWAVYTFKYECVHGMSTETDTVRESHSYAGYGRDEHVQGQQKHVYYAACIGNGCSHEKSQTVNCYGDVNGGSHTLP